MGTDRSDLSPGYEGGYMNGDLIPPLLAWGILISVLVMVASGKARFDLAAVSGLMVAGILGLASPAALLSGFGNPALFTIASVLLLSEAITESRLFSGLGHVLEKRFRTHSGQILGLSMATSALSAFMNNLGALSLTLPTALRMARRANLAPGTYTMPLAYAAIIGGTMTLAGSAPNIIISTYRAQSQGIAFGMFDFTPHGLIMVTTGLILWFVCGACGFKPGENEPAPSLEDASVSITDDPPDVFPGDILSTPQKRITLITVIPALALVSLGMLTPAVAFGSAALILVSTRVISPEIAYRRIDFAVIVFLGCMLGLARVLEETRAISLVTDGIAPSVSLLPPYLLVAALFLISSAVGSILNNAAAAAIMAPVALELSAFATVDALLMAVAAGSCLSVSLPTHQATLMAMSRGWFSPARFARSGLVITLVLTLVGSAVIVLFWG